MNLRICQKDNSGRHNFVGGVCANFCGVRQEDLNPVSINRFVGVDEPRVPLAKKMMSIHSREHLLAKDISEWCEEPKQFGKYLGVIKRVGFERACQILSEMKLSKRISHRGKLFMFKSKNGKGN